MLCTFKEWLNLEQEVYAEQGSDALYQRVFESACI